MDDGLDLLTGADATIAYAVATFALPIGAVRDLFHVPAWESKRWLCLRCGYRWDSHRKRDASGVLVPNDAEPRTCTWTFCHSKYWNDPPQRSTARDPESHNWQDDLPKHAAAIEAHRAERRRKRIEAAAAQEGYVLMKKGGTLTTPMVPMTPPTRMVTRTVATVPPPPGLEDGR